MPQKLKNYPKESNPVCLRFPGTTVLPNCTQVPRCPDCKAESKRVFARRSKLKAKQRIEDLQQESLELETELDDHEVTCDEIWAKKLAYEQEIEELILQREQNRETFMNN